MSIFRRIAQFIGGSGRVEWPQGTQVYDLRSSEELAIAQRARDGESLGPDVDALVKELIEVGTREGFLSEGAPRQDFPNSRENVPDPRTRAIGELLAERGGKDLMKAAYYRVEAQCGPRLARHLSIAWKYIAGWLP